MRQWARLAAECLAFPAALPALERVAALGEEAWPPLLNYTDRAGLTLHLLAALERAGLAAGLLCSARAALEARQEKNRLRLARRQEETACMLDLFRAAGLRAAVLKGFTLEPDFVPAAHLRSQDDLDFYLSPEDATHAHLLLRERGYQTLRSHDHGPASHLPVLVRKTGWEWRGDFFDPESPAGIDLHCRLWNPEFERIPAELEADPLSRMEWRRYAGRDYPAFCLNDRLASVVLHLVKHLFRRSLRLSHLYELAYFVERRVEDEAFWQTWRAARPLSLRRLTAAALAVAAHAFAVRPTPLLEAEHALLPAGARVWVPRFSSTVALPGTGSKCETLLQLALLEAWKDRALVLRRRLLPLSLPPWADTAYLPESSLTWKRRLQSLACRARFVLGRAFYHLRALPGFALALALWLWDQRTLSSSRK